MVSKNESARYFWARRAVFSAGVVVSRQPGGLFSSDGYVKLHRCSAGEVSGSRLLAIATRRATPDRSIHDAIWGACDRKRASHEQDWADWMAAPSRQDAAEASFDFPIDRPLRLVEAGE